MMTMMNLTKRTMKMTMMMKIEYKFKPEDIVWYIFRQEIFKAKVWLYNYEEMHENDKEVYKNYPALGIQYTVEILNGPGKGRMIVLSEDSLESSEKKCKERLKREIDWLKIIKENEENEQ